MLEKFNGNQTSKERQFGTHLTVPIKARRSGDSGTSATSHLSSDETLHLHSEACSQLWSNVYILMSSFGEDIWMIRINGLNSFCCYWNQVKYCPVRSWVCHRSQPDIFLATFHYQSVIMERERPDDQIHFGKNQIPRYRGDISEQELLPLRVFLALL